MTHYIVHRDRRICGAGISAEEAWEIAAFIKDAPIDDLKRAGFQCRTADQYKAIRETLPELPHGGRR